MRPHNWIYLLLFFSFFFEGSLVAQTDVPVDEPSGIREEVQRYFGYEELLYRYVTLPYDINSNVNQQGKYVDTGFLLMALLPLIFLLLQIKDLKRLILSCLGLSFYLLLCFRFSFIQDLHNSRFNPGQGDMMLTREASRFDGWILQQIYKINEFLISPIVSFIDASPDFHSKFTYPVMIVVFLGILYMVQKTKLSAKMKLLCTVLWTFGFLWWILSGGIIWYGFLIIPAGYLMIIYGITKRTQSNVGKFLNVYSLGVISIWLIMSAVLRISNIDLVNFALINDKRQLGKNIVEPRIHPYTVGQVDAQESLELLAKNLSKAMNELNNNESMIYKAGTSLSFDIKGNHKRVSGDPTLTYFNRLVNNYETRTGVTDAFKQNGYRYIILDLMMPTIDRTPEKSLTEKYILFINFIRDNSSLRMIATDRLVRNKKPDGSIVTEYALVGDEYLIPGSYIVYEIIE